jgi:hypothetical protein
MQTAKETSVSRMKTRRPIQKKKPTNLACKRQNTYVKINCIINYINSIIINIYANVRGGDELPYIYGGTWTGERRAKFLRGHYLFDDYFIDEVSIITWYGLLWCIIFDMSRENVFHVLNTSLEHYFIISSQCPSVR